MKEPKFCLVSSFTIFDISLVRRFLSALKGEILLRLLFCKWAPKPPPPEASVVFDFELVLFIANAGLRVGIVLITHR